MDCILKRFFRWLFTYNRLFSNRSVKFFHAERKPPLVSGDFETMKWASQLVFEPFFNDRLTRIVYGYRREKVPERRRAKIMEEPCLICSMSWAANMSSMSNDFAMDLVSVALSPAATTHSELLPLPFATRNWYDCDEFYRWIRLRYEQPQRPQWPKTIRPPAIRKR